MNPSHTVWDLHTAVFIRGGLPNKPTESHAVYTQSEDLMQQKPAEQVWLKFQSMVASADREAGIGLKPDGWSGGIHLVEWRSTRAPSEPCVTAKHHC